MHVLTMTFRPQATSFTFTYKNFKECEETYLTIVKAMGEDEATRVEVIDDSSRRATFFASDVLSIAMFDSHKISAPGSAAIAPQRSGLMS